MEPFRACQDLASNESLCQCVFPISLLLFLSAFVCFSAPASYASVSLTLIFLVFVPFPFSPYLSLFLCVSAWVFSCLYLSPHLSCLSHLHLPHAYVSEYWFSVLFFLPIPLSLSFGARETRPFVEEIPRSTPTPYTRSQAKGQQVLRKQAAPTRCPGPAGTARHG